MSGLGEFLNTVAHANPCPVCRRIGPMHVYVKAVRWPCGHVRRLPPIGQGGNYRTRRKKAA